MDDYLGERLRQERAGIGPACARVRVRRRVWRVRLRRAAAALARLVSRRTATARRR